MVNLRFVDARVRAASWATARPYLVSPIADRRLYDQREESGDGADQREESGEGADHRDEATTGADHRDDAVAWEVANEEETSDARAMKPTVNVVAKNLRMIYTLFV